MIRTEEEREFRKKEYYVTHYIDGGKIKQRSRQKPKDYEKKKKAKRRMSNKSKRKYGR